MHRSPDKLLNYCTSSCTKNPIHSYSLCVSSFELNDRCRVEEPNMSIIQDKLGNEFLRNGSMDPNYAPSMIMLSHLPPVTSFTRLTSQPVVTDLPQEMVLKKERDSPEHGGGFLHSMGIKQEKFNELDYRVPLYGTGLGTGGGKSSDMLDISLGSHQNMLLHDVNINSHLPGRLGKDLKDSTHRKGRRANGEGTEGRGRRKRGDSTKSMMLDGEGGPLSPSSKPHICEHCSAAFRSSYHLRRHVLIHTGERPFRCSQCNMSFIQKYLLQRHEKIHSGEKPFSCDQCNMRFIQKYHMERHKRTHSGEKPYKCDTCQQFFSRTDRLLKHKRTCGEAIKKGLDPGMLDLGDEDLGQGSYLHTQGNASAPPRKRGKSKNSGEGGERRRKKTASGTGQMVGLQDYTMDMAAGSGASASGVGNMADTSMANQHVRTPKLAFKKSGRKGGDKSLLSLGDAGSTSALHEQKLLPPKSNPMDLPGAGGMDSLGLLQGSSDSKQGGTSSNYDDAMQFLKKRRYLHAANSGGGDYSSVHLPPQQTVIQGGIGEPTLALLDTSPLISVDHKHDKSGIPDEVLQSLLDHYSHKSDVTFDLSDPHHVELHAASATPELGADVSSSNGSADKSGVMNEYSKFLLQTLERTSHSSSGIFTFFPEKHMYATSPLECTFGQSISSPHGPSSASVLPKPHFSMLVGSHSPSHSSPSSQQAFHLSSLETSAHQQLTPSQELTEQLDTQELANGQKDQHVKNGIATRANTTSSGSTSVYSLSSPPDLTALEPSKEVDMRPTFQIENFAQAFGSQFKSERRTSLAYSADPQIVIVEVDPRISRTPVSEFSGYTSLLADVNEPASSGTKTPTSQSYR